MPLCVWCLLGCSLSSKTQLTQFFYAVHLRCTKNMRDLFGKFCLESIWNRGTCDYLVWVHNEQIFSLSALLLFSLVSHSFVNSNLFLMCAVSLLRRLFLWPHSHSLLSLFFPQLSMLILTLSPPTPPLSLFDSTVCLSCSQLRCVPCAAGTGQSCADWD